MCQMPNMGFPLSARWGGSSTTTSSQWHHPQPAFVFHMTCFVSQYDLLSCLADWKVTRCLRHSVRAFDMWFDLTACILPVLRQASCQSCHVWASRSGGRAALAYENVSAVNGWGCCRAYGKARTVLMYCQQRNTLTLHRVRFGGSGCHMAMPV